MSTSDFLYCNNIKRLLYEMTISELGLFQRSVNHPSNFRRAIQMSFEKLQTDTVKRGIYNNMSLFIRLYGSFNKYPDTEQGDCDYMDYVFHGVGDYIKRTKRMKRLLIKAVNEYGDEWGEPVRNRIIKSLRCSFGLEFY